MASAISAPAISDRVDALDWDRLRSQLDDRGFAVTQQVFDDVECAELSELFDGGRFRTTVDMARHRYFDHPLPKAITAAPGPSNARVP